MDAIHEMLKGREYRVRDKVRSWETGQAYSILDAIIDSLNMHLIHISGSCRPWRKFIEDCWQNLEEILNELGDFTFEFSRELDRLIYYWLLSFQIRGKLTTMRNFAQAAAVTIVHNREVITKLKLYFQVFSQEVEFSPVEDWDIDGNQKRWAAIRTLLQDLESYTSNLLLCERRFEKLDTRIEEAIQFVSPKGPIRQSLTSQSKVK